MSLSADIEYKILNEGVKHNVELGIGDRVQLVEDTKKTIYTIYSITQYSDHTAYTLWNGEDYISVERWQFEKYEPKKSIGLTIDE